MVKPFWWSSSGDFEADASGLYPQARQVVAQYRRLSGLTRDQLALQLKIGAKAMYYAEKEGRGLDSIARLRDLQALLRIPPVLLGLCDAPGPAGWWLTEYEPWQSEPAGWPDVGAVVKHYRRAKGWTQAQLAVALGVQELAVRNMENIHAGLDSLTRRRALRFLLAIPPVLLGLDSEHIAREFGGALIGTTRIPSPELIASFRASADSLWSGYIVSHVQDKVGFTLNWLEQAREITSMAHGAQRLQMLEAQSLGYQALTAISKAYAPDMQVMSYANQSVSLAHASHNSDLVVIALQRRAEMLLDRGYVDLAQRSAQEALIDDVSNSALSLSRSAAIARILAATASDAEERSMVRNLLDKSQPATGDDPFGLYHDSEILTVRTGQTLVLLAAHTPKQEARGLYRQTEKLLRNLAPESARRAILAKLSLAQAYVGLGEPDYAVTLALEALPLMDQLKSVLYLPPLAALYRELRQSTLRQSPQVARLGLYLSERGAL